MSLPSDLHKWEKQQALRAYGVAGCLLLSLLCVLLGWWLAHPSVRPGASDIWITSSPSGAKVYRPAHLMMSGLQLGQEVRGRVEASELGTTPYRMAWQQTAQGHNLDYFGEMWLRKPGYAETRLRLPVSPTPGVYRGTLPVRWPDIIVEAPRQHPWAFASLCFLSLAVLQLALARRSQRQWQEQQRKRRVQGLRPGVEVGGYRIESQIGQGGMGRVFRGTHLETGEKAAIKLLFEASALDVAARRRFEGEINALRRLHHPNIVLVLDWGEVDGQLYLIQEYLEGQTLEEAWQGPRSWTETRPVLAQLVRGLMYIHQQNWVHLDLEPANLMLLGDGRLKILDFGISSPADHQGSAIRGTPGFMAPEQIGGKPSDWRADLYSLGVLMYQALTGQVLFEAESPVQLMVRHLEETAPDLPGAAAPPEVATLVSRLLAKAPLDRFETKQEFADACRCFYSDGNPGAQSE